jgi:uncharacterized membrane protein YvbJ
MKCTKCGQSLHPDQKICINCGQQTDKWPGGPKVEVKPPVEIPWKMVGIAGGGLLVLIIAIVVAMALRTVPPDQVTRKWVEACIVRNVDRAKQYTTQSYEDSLFDRSASAEKADNYFEFLHENTGSGYQVSKPTSTGPKSAQVIVTFKGGPGQELINRVQLTKQGKIWKIEQVF